MSHIHQPGAVLSGYLQKLEPILESLENAGYRLPVLMEGDRAWALKECEKWLADSGRLGLWFSDSAPQAAWVLQENRINHELGRESHGVIFDLYSGLNLDALAAAAGTIKSGGCLIIIAPALDSWLKEGEGGFNDPFMGRLNVEMQPSLAVKRHFLKRMAHLFQQSPYLARIKQHDGLALPQAPQAPQASGAACVTEYQDHLGCVNAQQRTVVEAILQLQQSTKPGPLVIEADRGRGKSAAMGIAVATLLAQGKQVVVTAPRPQTVETFLRFCGPNQPTFYAPDNLLLTLPQADLLIVDEAAAIAPSMLAEMVGHYAKSVLATTIDGYEGTGRGFHIRFKPWLNEHAPHWRCLSLSEPVRWRQGDWVETLIDRLLLQRQPANNGLISVGAECQFSELTVDEQWNEAEEHRLSQIYRLLVDAHYRTRPNDLRTLLDAANIRTFYLLSNHQVVAVAMIAQEGNLPAELASDIMSGKRRPRGQNLPQTLAVHCHQPAVLDMALWRVVRIAVTPQWQGKGLGTQLLGHIHDLASREQVDLVGSVFSADEKVLQFWHSNQYSQLRLGYTVESTTGCYTSVVAKGLTNNGQKVEHQASHWFAGEFPHLLTETHSNVPWQVALHIVQSLHPPQQGTAEDVHLVNDYIQGKKVYENVAPSLWRWLWANNQQAASNVRALPSVQQQLFVGKILQKHPWHYLVKVLKISGTKEAKRLLQAAFKAIYE